MLRKILLPLDPSPYAASALDYACHIANTCDAEITGLAVLDMPGIENTVGSVPVGGLHYAEKMIDAKRKKEMDHITRLTTRFEDKCRIEGVKCNVSEFQGSPSSRLIQESMYYDMVIMGLRTFYNFNSLDGSGESIESILDSTITPIIAVPEKFAINDNKLKAIVAFDQSQPAARAVQRFAQLVRTAMFEVKVLTCGGDEEPSREALEKVKQYLEAHGFTNVYTEWTSQGKIDAVKERYIDWADIFVLGLHSHHVLVDFMIGSLSRFLIRDGRKLLLLGQ